jgi:hypothetical protein
LRLLGGERNDATSLVGLLDEVAIFNRALRADEVHRLAQGP